MSVFQTRIKEILASADSFTTAWRWFPGTGTSTRTAWCADTQVQHAACAWKPDYNCPVCAGGPLLLRTASLASLDPALPRDLALLDLGLRTRHAGLQLACPGSTQYSAQCPH